MPLSLRSLFRHPAQPKRRGIMRTLRNWRHLYLAKTLISGGIVGVAALVLDQLSRYHEAQRLWDERHWLLAHLKAIALPPWAQFFLLVACLLAFIWAIYELQTRPPIVRETETRYAVG